MNYKIVYRIYGISGLRYDCFTANDVEEAINKLKKEYNIEASITIMQVYTNDCDGKQISVPFNTRSIRGEGSI